MATQSLPVQTLTLIWNGDTFLSLFEPLRSLSTESKVMLKMIMREAVEIITKSVRALKVTKKAMTFQSDTLDTIETMQISQKLENFEWRCQR